MRCVPHTRRRRASRAKPASRTQCASRSARNASLKKVPFVRMDKRDFFVGAGGRTATRKPLGLLACIRSVSQSAVAVAWLLGTSRISPRFSSDLPTNKKRADTPKGYLLFWQRRLIIIPLHPPLVLGGANCSPRGCKAFFRGCKASFLGGAKPLFWGVQN